MNHASGAGSIARPVDQQSSTIPLFHGFPLNLTRSHQINTGSIYVSNRRNHGTKITPLNSGLYTPIVACTFLKLNRKPSQNQSSFLNDYTSRCLKGPIVIAGRVFKFIPSLFCPENAQRFMLHLSPINRRPPSWFFFAHLLTFFSGAPPMLSGAIECRRARVHCCGKDILNQNISQNVIRHLATFLCVLYQHYENKFCSCVANLICYLYIQYIS